MSNKNDKDKKNIDELKFILSQHIDDLQRYGSWVGEQSAMEFESTSDKVLSLIERIYKNFGSYNIDKETQDKLTEAKELITELRETCYNNQIDFISNQQKELINNESKWNKAWLLALFGYSYTSLTNKDKEDIYNYGIFGKQSTNSVYNQILQKDIDRIFNQLKQGLISGIQLNKLKDNIRKELDKTNMYIKNDTVSIINGVSNDVVLYIANENKLKLMWVAILDDHVCSECDSLHDNIYDYDESIPSIPRHNRCRCTLVLVNDEIEKENKNGKKDILNTNFTDYLDIIAKNGNEKEIEQRLGKKLYLAYKNNNLEYGKFYDPEIGSKFTIKDLKQKDIKAFV